MLTEPIVHPQVWQTIPDKKIRPAKVGSDLIKNGACDQKTEIAQKNQLCVLSLIQRTAGIEVVDSTEEAVALPLSASFFLVLVIIMTGGIGQEVHWPAEELLTDNPASR